MNSGKMAEFIYLIRKTKNITQKQLAEKLGISDKAISKWERGLSLPDIRILSPLAKALGVSTAELLEGKKDENPAQKNEEIVKNTLDYADKVSNYKRRNFLWVFKLVVNITFFVAIVTCIIVDLAVSGRLSWSRYPISSIIYAWLIIRPLFNETYKVFVMLLDLSIFTVPYLFVLEGIIGGVKFVLPLGMPIAISAIIYLWLVYILFCKTKIRPWYSASLTALLGVVLNFIIDIIVSSYLKIGLFNTWDILSYSVLFVLAAVFFWIGYISVYKEEVNTF